MSCDELDARLDDYVDGALDAAGQRDAQRHLALCARCREEEAALRALLREAASLPHDREPARDLWPEVASRLARGRRPWAVSWPVALAAAAALAAVSSALTVVALRRGPAPADQAQATASAAPAARPVALASGLRESEAEYVQATAALMKALDARRTTLPPETVQVLEDNLRVIDQALAEIRGALGQDPENTGLVHMLVSTHRKKVDTLERVLKLSTRA